MKVEGSFIGRNVHVGVFEGHWQNSFGKQGFGIVTTAGLFVVKAVGSFVVTQLAPKMKMIKNNDA